MGRLRRASVLIAVLVGLPSLSLGLVLDDYFLLARADGGFRTGRPLDFFTFAAEHWPASQFVAHGPFPWWTLGDLRLSFFRPLSSLSFQLDRWLWGDHFWLYHLHSLALMVAMVAVVGGLLSAVLPSRTAGLAAIIYALDDSHALPQAWLANRNSILATLIAASALWAWVRFRQQGWAPGRWLAALGLAVAFTAGESTLGTVSFFVAFELFQPEPVMTRLRTSVPWVAVGALWALGYRLMHCGAFGSATYLDPGVDVGGFLAEAPARISAMLGSLTLGLTSDIWLVAPQFRPLLIGAGVLGSVLMAFTVRMAWRQMPAQTQRSLQWLVLGSLGALVPVASTFPADRLLLPASLGASALFAALLEVLWQQRSLVSRAAIVWLGAVSLVFPLAPWVVGPWLVSHWATAGRQSVLEAPLTGTERSVLLVTTPDPSPAMYGPFYLQNAGRPTPRNWLTLSMDPNGHRISWVDDHTLELESTGGFMFNSVFEQLVRDEHHALATGDSVELEGVTVTVVDGAGSRVRRIQARFSPGVERPTLLYWRDGAFHPLPELPKGAVLEVPRQPTLMESVI